MEWVVPPKAASFNASSRVAFNPSRVAERAEGGAAKEDHWQLSGGWRPRPAPLPPHVSPHQGGFFINNFANFFFVQLFRHYVIFSSTMLHIFFKTVSTICSMFYQQCYELFFLWKNVNARSPAANVFFLINNFTKEKILCETVQHFATVLVVSQLQKCRPPAHLSKDFCNPTFLF